MTCCTPVLLDPPSSPDAWAGPPGAADRSRRRSWPPSLSERLDAEWARLARHRGVLHEVRGWGLTAPDEAPITDLHDLLVRCGHRQPDDAGADRLLVRLVARAATDRLAARIVLQRIVPGLLAIAKIEQRRQPGLDAFEALVAEAWVSIVLFPVETRGSQVAARLISDARHRAFTNVRRRRRLPERLCPPQPPVEPRHPPDRSPFEELTATLTRAREEGLADHELDVLRGLVRCGSATRLADELGVTTRTIRYRRRYAIARVRRLLALPGAEPVAPRRARVA